MNATTWQTFFCDDCGRDITFTVDDGLERERHGWNCDRRKATERRLMELEMALFLAQHEGGAT